MGVGRYSGECRWKRVSHASVDREALPRGGGLFGYSQRVRHTGQPRRRAAVVLPCRDIEVSVFDLHRRRRDAVGSMGVQHGGASAARQENTVQQWRPAYSTTINGLLVTSHG